MKVLRMVKDVSLMITQANNELVTYVLQFMLIMLSALAGSYAKDYQRAIKCGSGRVDMRRVFLSDVTATVVMFALSDYVVDKWGMKVLITLSFIAGLIGFQLLEKLSTIEGLKDLILDYLAFRRGEGERPKKPHAKKSKKDEGEEDEST